MLVDLASYEPQHLAPRRRGPPPRADERLEWSSPPIALILSLPFIITLLSDAIELHDISTLSALQKIRITTPPPTLSPISNAQHMCVSDLGCGRVYLYVCSPDQVKVSVIFRCFRYACNVTSRIYTGELFPNDSSGCTSERPGGKRRL